MARLDSIWGTQSCNSISHNPIKWVADLECYQTSVVGIFDSSHSNLKSAGLILAAHLSSLLSPLSTGYWLVQSCCEEVGHYMWGEPE